MDLSVQLALTVRAAVTLEESAPRQEPVLCGALLDLLLDTSSLPVLPLEYTWSCPTLAPMPTGVHKGKNQPQGLEKLFLTSRQSDLSEDLKFI